MSSPPGSPTDVGASQPETDDAPLESASVRTTTSAVKLTWRNLRAFDMWAGVIIVLVLAFSALYGFIVIPVVQEHRAGIDPFTAICRVIGIAPSAPAVRPPTNDAKAQPTTEGLRSRFDSPSN
jgi:hypothetical protein